jgi:hypothetical protein
VVKLERILSREASLPEKYADMDKLKVGIVGISAGAGVSFLAGCLARYLANTGIHSPAVIELGGGSLYDSFGMDKRFAGRTWFGFYKALAEGRSIRGVRNMDEGINWILKAPEEGKISLAFEQKLRLISHAKGDVILCDLSGEEKPDFELMRSLDQLIAVVDPMPSKMLEGHQNLCNIKMLDTEKKGMIFVINKMNRGVNRRQMLDFLKIRKPVILPLVSPESVYTAEYNCKIPYTLAEVKNTLRGPMEEIASALVL